jgi:hypothetical protein
VVVHSVLPAALTAVIDDALVGCGITHVSHEGEGAISAAERAVSDGSAVALIGPFRSREVADAVEVTAPAGLPLLAPVATWAGVTRDDEPGCEDDPADHRGTVFRMLARDTEVAQRIAADLRRRTMRAFVVAGDHEYGYQLDGQLERAGLDRAPDPADADVIVLCGLVDEPEARQAAALAPLPIVAFDGVQGSELGSGQVVRLALPFAPSETATDALWLGADQTRAAVDLVSGCVRAGAGSRALLLEAIRGAGGFDRNGDLLNPPVWLWQADEAWSLSPDRPLPG